MNPVPIETPEGKQYQPPSLTSRCISVRSAVITLIKTLTVSLLSITTYFNTELNTTADLRHIIIILSSTHRLYLSYSNQRPFSSVKPGFHYPSSRPEFTGRVDGPWTRVSGAFFDTRVDGPSWRVSKNATEFTGRQLGSWTRAVNSSSGNRALLSRT